MELTSSQEGEIHIPIPMPMPLNSTYAHNKKPINQQHQTPSSNGSPTINDHDHLVPYKKTTAARYKECLKNHAAALGGNATDGCGEFLPGGEDGLTCSACNCHRNFHRKETDDHEADLCELPQNSDLMIMSPRMIDAAKIFVGHSLKSHHNQMVMPYNNNNNIVAGKRKRFRTKFSQEQKEKMLGFAEKVGWKMQNQEEGVVQKFCQEVGIKRRVLKVWMHNNKHQFANKNHDLSNPNPNHADQSQQH